MDTSEVAALPCGAQLTDTGCRFRLWAPNASHVTVIGSFNAWDENASPLASGNDGIWEALVINAQAGDEYLFVINNRGGDDDNPGEHGLRRIDPRARATRGSAGNAIIVDVAGELHASGLHDDPFRTPPLTDWLIYQVHIGSFVGGGDRVDTGQSSTGTFTQFRQKLDYIRSLGFNAVALLPIQENPGDGNEGYGPSHFFAPESSFGSPFELRQLVRAAHAIGLAVVFDVVWNHLSDFDNRLWDFDGMTRLGGIYFEEGERSPWGPRPAFWKREVRDLIVDNARSWFAEYHVDGLRVDAADEIDGAVLRAAVTAIRAQTACAPLLIAEWSGGDSPGWDRLVHEDGFDRVWSLGDPFDFRLAVDEANALPDRVGAIVALIELPEAAARIRYLLGSHDAAHDNLDGERAGHRHFVEFAGGRNDPVARAKARLGWALCIALPGTPMCFMGTEVCQPGYWHPRPDANPLHGDHRFDWSLTGDDIGLEMRALVQAANQLRWDWPALRGDWVELVHRDDQGGVVAFLRRTQRADDALVILNVSGNSWDNAGYRVPLQLDSREWRVIFDSQGAAFGGPGLQPMSSRADGGGLMLTLPPWAVVVLVSSG